MGGAAYMLPMSVDLGPNTLPSQYHPLAPRGVVVSWATVPALFSLLHSRHSHLAATTARKRQRSDGPERRPLEGARMRHQRPCRRPLRPERAALALWVTPVHASSMVESTADDHLTLDGDANVCAGAKQKVSAMSLGVMDTGS